MNLPTTNKGLTFSRKQEVKKEIARIALLPIGDQFEPLVQLGLSGEELEFALAYQAGFMDAMSVLKVAS